MKLTPSKTAICVILFLFINFVFAVKYLSRITPYYLIYSLVIVGSYYLLWRYSSHLKIIPTKLTYLNIALLCTFAIGSIIIFYKVPPLTLNVDRFSVISSFWDNYFAGKYAYFAKSHMGNAPGPMPFYFILALPFYLMGELGYLSLLGGFVFYSTLRYDKKSSTQQTAAILLIILSMFYLWEVICRSNLFLNSTLILCSIIYFFKSTENKKANYILCNGIIIGLLLSTRNVFIIPYIITFLFALKTNIISIKNTLKIALIAISTFIITFIPFVLNHFDDFTKANPFIIQSSILMPLHFTFICILLSLASFFILKQKSDVFFYSALILFLTIILYNIHLLTRFGFQRMFYDKENVGDISYFIFCVPFLLYYMLHHQKEHIGFKKQTLS